MSLVSTYVLCDDLLFYKEPPIGGIIDDISWKMIWDDEDPPELCIRCKLKGRSDKNDARGQAEYLRRELAKRGLRLELGAYIPGRIVGHVWEVRLLSLPPVALFEEKRTGVLYPKGECVIVIPATAEGRAAFDRAQANHFEGIATVDIQGATHAD